MGKIDKPQNSDMKDVMFFAKLTSLIPIIWLLSFLVALLVGYIYFGHIPSYGIDRDPNYINSVTLTKTVYIITFCELVGVFATPAWFFLIIHLLIGKAKFESRDIIFHVAAIVGLIMFFLFRFVWTSQFEWVSD
jgi:hypothetical protein